MELFSHGAVHTASFFGGGAPSPSVTPDLCTCLMQQQRYIYFKLIKQGEYTIMFITGTHRNTMKRTPRGERFAVASKTQNTINIHGKKRPCLECIVSEGKARKFIKLKITLLQNSKMARFPQYNNSPRKCCQRTDWPAKKNREKEKGNSEAAGTRYSKKIQ